MDIILPEKYIKIVIPPDGSYKETCHTIRCEENDLIAECKYQENKNDYKEFRVVNGCNGKYTYKNTFESLVIESETPKLFE